MNNLLEEIIKMTTSDYNFRQVDSKLLLIVNLVLPAVIASFSGIGTIESLEFTIFNNIVHIFWGIYSFVISLALKWLWVEIVKKHSNYKQRKIDDKKLK